MYRYGDQTQLTENLSNTLAMFVLYIVHHFIGWISFEVVFNLHANKQFEMDWW